MKSLSNINRKIKSKKPRIIVVNSIQEAVVPAPAQANVNKHEEEKSTNNMVIMNSVTKVIII